MNNHYSGRYVKKNGRLEFLSHAQARQFDVFLSHVKENQIVEFFYECTHDDGTLPQLAKLHVLIKQLAMHTGNTFDDMKLLVKDKAGLCITREVSGKEYFLVKSFGESSKEELSLAIQACVEIGEEVNLLIH
jgi:hypothetical protein